MLHATTVSNDEELKQIYILNQKFLKQNLSEEEKNAEGFVTWLYTPDLLQKMHSLSPSIIVKDGERVAGYALATLRESRHFHNDLEKMFLQLDDIPFHGKRLSEHNFYCMGQICIDKPYRGKGLVNMLYQEHKRVYGKHYNFILTEISTSNTRSLKAHFNNGFQTIYTYRDNVDEWNVVVWEWG
jgi:ribosomal protein S18 acetylase RimI-like enzyme